jgi:hypothetical protein
LKTTATEKLKKQQFKRFVKSQTKQRVKRSPTIPKKKPATHQDEDEFYDPETYEKILTEHDERQENNIN